MEIFAQRLKAARERQGLSQKELSYRVSVSQQYYGRFEKDLAQPNLETLVKIATELQVTTDYLLGMKEENNTHRVLVNGSEIIVHVQVNEKTSSS